MYKKWFSTFNDVFDDSVYSTPLHICWVEHLKYSPVPSGDRGKNANFFSVVRPQGYSYAIWEDTCCMSTGIEAINLLPFLPPLVLLFHVAIS